MTDYWYVLAEDGETAVPCADLAEWTQRYARAHRIVARTQVGTALVSTVFLGIDHRFGGGGPPVLWETMIFTPVSEGDEYQRRYTSHADAIAGHALAVRIANGEVARDD